MKRIKHIIVPVLCRIFVFNPLLPIHAQETAAEIEYLSDGSYYLTEIQVDSVPSARLSAANRTRTVSKTARYFSSSGNVLWYVKLTATFTYNGTTSSCISAYATADSYSSSWKISRKSASKTGNKAAATAAAT